MLNNSIADILMGQLMMCDKVRLLDRSVLGTQMDELNLTGEYINPATAIQKGKNIGAQYASNAQIGTLKASVNITTRVVDLPSEVVFMCSGTGRTQGKSQLSLEYGALGGAELNGGTEGFKQTITGKAIQKAFVTIGHSLDNFFSGNTDKKVVGSVSGLANYGQDMSVKGTKLYMGTEKLDREGIQLAFSENPDLYFQYKKGKRRAKLSWLPMFGGAVIGAVIMGQVGAWEDDEALAMGGIVMAAGVGSGIYMRIAGKNKIKKVVEQYNVRQKFSYYSPCQLGVCINQNGCGLRIIF